MKKSNLKLVLDDRVTARDAIALLSRTDMRLLPVVDENDVLLGIIADGDLREAVLLQKYDLREIINYKPVTMPAGAKNSEILQVLKKHGRTNMPLVDEQNRFVEVIHFDPTEIETITSPVVIMAGGLGSRLGELTKSTPKPMLPVGGRPIIEETVTMLKRQGFVDLFFSVNYKSHVIKEHFGNGSAYGISIRYLEEPEPLGTAGSLNLIRDQLGQDASRLVVMNGDILTTLDFTRLAAFHKERGAAMTVCAREKQYQIPYGVIKTDGDRVAGLEEKPVQHFFINAGIYVLETRMLEYIPRNTRMDMTELILAAIRAEEKVAYYPMDEFWIDIGQKQDYFTAVDQYARLYDS